MDADWRGELDEWLTPFVAALRHKMRSRMSAPFRQGLSERGLTWAVGIPFRQKVYAHDVTLIFPVAGRGRPRKNAIPDVRSISAKAMLEAAKWRMVSWRRGTYSSSIVRHLTFGTVMSRVNTVAP